MARIAGIDLPKNKRGVIGLTYIYGIGRSTSEQILKANGIDENIKVQDLTESAIYKLRKHVEQIEEGNEAEEDVGDDFENLYKGEISKSGTPILPSKRARKAPEKIQVSKDDLAELSQTAQPEVDTPASDEESDGQVSLEEVSESENQEPEVNPDETDGSNS